MSRDARYVETPCALAIGGLDPGGGAGIIADVRAFEAAGVLGCAAVSLLTVQSTAGLRRVHPLRARELLSQAREVLDHQRVTAIKVGALATRENIVAVARLLRERPKIPAVVDTPMLPTRGRGRLTAERALDAMRDELLPAAALVTVNAAEAEALAGGRVTTVSEATSAALRLVERGARAVLVKGGHLEGPWATDVLRVGDATILLRARRAAAALHGAGCTLASLIAGRLAQRGASHGRLSSADLVLAVRWAKVRHRAAIARAARVGEGLLVLRFAAARARQVM